MADAPAPPHSPLPNQQGLLLAWAATWFPTSCLSPPNVMGRFGGSFPTCPTGPRWYLGWWGLGGGGTPAERTRGAQGTFQSSSSPEVPPFFRCSRLDFSAGRPTWIPRLGTQPESKRHSRPIVGAHCLPHPPSFLSSTTLHPWYRSLLWLQGYDTSPGHHGLKE